MQLPGKLAAKTNSATRTNEGYQLDGVDGSQALDETLFRLGFEASNEILVGDNGQLDGVLLEALDLKLLKLDVIDTFR